jgi:hypothetical protein
MRQTTGPEASLGATVEEVREHARRVARERIAPGARQRDVDRSFPRDGIRALGEAGLLEVGISRSAGGIGGDRVAFAAVAQEVGAQCASTGLVYVTTSIVAKAIEVAASPEVRKRWLPELLSGRSIGAFAVHEPESGCTSAAITTRARRQNGGYVVNGSKFFITSAQEADVYVVLVKNDSPDGLAGMSALVVERDAPGLSFGLPEDKLGLTSTSTRDMFFRDCRVPAGNLLGKEGDGHGVMAQAMAGWGFFGAAAIAAGIARSATDLSVSHARERTVAGKPIGAHQAVQMTIADMLVSSDAAESFLLSCAARADESPKTAGLYGSRAKLLASETAIDVANRAIQVHGGHGYVREYVVERLFRDARGLTLHFKTSELLRQDIAGAALAR